MGKWKLGLVVKMLKLTRVGFEIGSVNNLTIFIDVLAYKLQVHITLLNTETLILDKSFMVFGRFLCGKYFWLVHFSGGKCFITMLNELTLSYLNFWDFSFVT